MSNLLLSFPSVNLVLIDFIYVWELLAILSVGFSSLDLT